MPAMSGVDKPIPLIRADGQGFTLCPEAATLISSLTGPIAVVAVAGLYRTGKSFVLNKLIDKGHDGFTVGPTVKACTKGLWIWGKPIKHKLANGQTANILLLDTEGIGSLDATQTHDVQIFSLALLLSSFFLYNSLGNIDENALNQLSLVVNLTKHVHVKTRPASARGEAEDPAELARFFPSFLWLLRDFSLRLEDEAGRPISAGEYMESALAPVKEAGPNDERAAGKNKIRSLLRAIFKERDCMTLVRPVMDEHKLQSLDKVPPSEFRPEFRAQLDRLKERVFSRVQAKQVMGTALNGPMFIQLARAYIDALNKGAVPTIQSAWHGVVQSECAAAAGAAAGAYREEVDRRKLQLPLHEGELERLHAEIRDVAMEAFRERAVVASAAELAPFLAQVKESVEKDFALLRQSNARASKDACAKLLHRLWAERRVDEKAYESMAQFEEDRAKVLGEYLELARGPARDEALAVSMKEKSLAVAARLRDAAEKRAAEERKEWEAKRAAADEERRQQQAAAEKTRAALDAERGRLEAERARAGDLQQRLDRTAAEAEDLRKKLGEAREAAAREAAEARARLEEAHKAAEGEAGRVKEREGALKEARGKAEALEKEKAALAKEKHALEAELEKQRGRAAALEADLRDAREAKRGAEREAAEARSSASASSSSLAKENAALEKEKALLEKENAALAKEKAAAEKRLAEREREAEAAARDLAALRKELQEANAKAAEAAEERAERQRAQERVRELEEAAAAAPSPPALDADFQDSGEGEGPSRKRGGSAASTPKAAAARRTTGSRAKPAPVQEEPEEDEEDEEEEGTLVNPEKMKIQQLMSFCTKHDIELPGNKMKKDFYVNLVRQKLPHLCEPK